VGGSAPFLRSERAVYDDADVVKYLVDLGVLSADRVVRSGVQVQWHARRNRNIRVELGDGSGFFVKHADPTSVLSRETVRSEGEFYRTHQASSSPLAGVLCDLIHFDETFPVLVLDLLSHHRTLRDIWLEEESERFPIAIFRTAGRTLGEFHARSDSWVPGLGSAVPPSFGWMSNIQRPNPGVLERISQGGLAVMEIVQSSPVIGSRAGESRRDVAKRIRHSWRRQGGQHHGRCPRECRRPPVGRLGVVAPRGPRVGFGRAH
jgi:hypothetical protein